MTSLGAIALDPVRQTTGADWRRPTPRDPVRPVKIPAPRTYGISGKLSPDRSHYPNLPQNAHICVYGESDFDEHNGIRSFE
jgi:hypothetical protein